jgi:hypothetical protein
MATLRGSCHCGNLTVSFETTLDPAATRPRACQCSFCLRHGTRAVSDPTGKVAVTVQDGSQLMRYRFGLKTADFLICGRCGVHMAAVMTGPEGTYATLNSNVLDDRARFPTAAEPFDYAGEDEAGRRARRRARWTPATVTVLAPGRPPPE